MKVGEEKMTINYFYLDKATYDKAFTEAGFVDFKYEPMILSEDTPEEHAAWLKAFLSSSPVITFSARKPE
jgi:hypothetical protein